MDLIKLRASSLEQSLAHARDLTRDPRPVFDSPQIMEYLSLALVKLSCHKSWAQSVAHKYQCKNSQVFLYLV